MRPLGARQLIAPCERNIDEAVRRHMQHIRTVIAGKTQMIFRPKVLIDLAIEIVKVISRERRGIAREPLVRTGRIEKRIDIGATSAYECRAIQQREFESLPRANETDRSQ